MHSFSESRTNWQSIAYRLPIRYRLEMMVSPKVSSLHWAATVYMSLIGTSFTVELHDGSNFLQ